MRGFILRDIFKESINEASWGLALVQRERWVKAGWKCIELHVIKAGCKILIHIDSEKNKTSRMPEP